MVSAISSTSTSSTSVVSTSDSSTSVAALKAELAAKQTALADAKTDDEKSKINTEITKLKGEISKLSGTAKQDTTQAAGSSQKQGSKATDQQFVSADKSAPESKVSPAAMDVLMQLGSRGGMMPGGSHNGAGGAPDLSKLYAGIDGDSNGKVTKEEFVAGRDPHMSEDDASKMFAALDADSTGYVTADEFTSGVKAQGDHGGRPMGPPPGGMGAPPAGQQPATTTASAVTTITG